MANPSPLCEVKDGSGAYQATAGGVDVTTGNTVTIRLSSQTDVDSWLIECATTDDTSSASTVTASLSIDSTNKTATFTAPAAGKAYRFRSRVNQGIDRNGVAQSSYETTFCVYTVKNGRRVMAADETTETNATFGWTKWLNDIIRSVPSGAGDWENGAGGGGGGTFQLFGVSNNFLSYQGGSAVGASGLDYVPTTGIVSANRGLLVNGTAVATIAHSMLVAGTGATGFNFIAPIMQGAQVTGVATLASVALGNYATIGSGTHATVGGVRVTTNAQQIIAGRNSGDTADVEYISISASNVLHVGTDTAFTSTKQAPGINIYGTSASFVALGLGASTGIYITSAGVGCYFQQNLGLYGGSASFPGAGGGVGVFAVANANTNPSTNPTGGGILYADAGAGKWRGSSGTVTTFGSAEPHCQKCGTDVGISHAENDIFGEELIHCHACELRTGNGVVRHIADFFERKKAA